MKKLLTIFALAAFTACGTPGTGGVEEDSTNKTMPDMDNSVPPSTAIPDSLNNRTLDSTNQANGDTSFNRN